MMVDCDRAIGSVTITSAIPVCTVERKRSTLLPNGFFSYRENKMSSVGCTNDEV